MTEFYKLGQPIDHIITRRNIMASTIQCLDLGRMDYRQAYVIQEKIHRACYQGLLQDTIIIQENNPIFTLGRNGKEEHLLLSVENLKKIGIDVEYVDRGGDITYHGPGQLVMSPIIHLRNYVSTIHQYVRNLEEMIIRVLRKYDIQGNRIDGASGVWVGLNKVAAVGIAIEHGITRHGIAININPNMNHFKYIIPCGIRDKGVTSLSKLGVETTELSLIKYQFIEEFNQLFNTATNKIELDEVRILYEY